MRSPLAVRALAAFLAIAAFMPWYSSQALVDHDTYLGNPLPWIDWLLLTAALVTIVRPQLRVPTVVIALIDVTLGWMLMYGDSAEGLDVSLLPGLPLATAATVGLFMTHMRSRVPASAA